MHPGRVVVFGLFNDEAGTEDVAVVAEVETSDPQEKEKIAEMVRQTVAHGSAVVLRHVHLVGAHWLVKTSSGKIARSANREKFLDEINSQG